MGEHPTETGKSDNTEEDDREAQAARLTRIGFLRYFMNRNDGEKPDVVSRFFNGILEIQWFERPQRRRSGGMSLL